MDYENTPAALVQICILPGMFELSLKHYAKEFGEVRTLNFPEASRRVVPQHFSHDLVSEGFPLEHPTTGG
jgi:hypothetical protein